MSRGACLDIVISQMASQALHPSHPLGVRPFGWQLMLHSPASTVQLSFLHASHVYSPDSKSPSLRFRTSLWKSLTPPTPSGRHWSAKLWTAQESPGEWSLTSEFGSPFWNPPRFAIVLSPPNHLTDDFLIFLPVRTPLSWEVPTRSLGMKPKLPLRVWVSLNFLHWGPSPHPPQPLPPSLAHGQPVLFCP